MKIFFSILILLILSYQGKSQRMQVNILDSNVVKTFIGSSTVCEQIQVAHQFSSYIVEQKGYGMKLLQALSKGTDYRFYLPIATGGILLTRTQRVNDLEEQLKDLQQKIKCNIVKTDTLTNR